MYITRDSTPGRRMNGVTTRPLNALRIDTIDASLSCAGPAVPRSLGAPTLVLEQIDPTVPLTWLIAAAFLAGGAVKGVIGIGLPLVVVPVLATSSGAVEAVALMVVPTAASNVMQAYQAGLRLEAARRFWPAIVGIAVGGWLGSTILTGVEPGAAQVGLASVVVLFCLTQLIGKLPAISPHTERWFTPVAGIASGAAGGLTGFFGLALVPYLLALRLTREDFVATIALLYLFGLTALYSNLAFSGLYNGRIFLTSALASVPTLAGVWLGSLLRRRVNEAIFRRLLIVVLFLIALNLIRRGAF